MFIINSPSQDAYFNIALEEYLLYQYPTEDIFLLYINAPSIIVGKFQNTLAEINLDYVQDKKIKVVRRMSGGGAVYHDLGNLNFSFHTLLGGNDFMDFSQFTSPVVKILNNLNVPAKLEGRNDLLVDGKKFSGNAKLARNGKMIQHGTLLFNSEMSVLNDALKINPLKYKDKAVKSNRSRVINLSEYLPEEMTTENLKQLLIKEIMVSYEDASIYNLTNEDISKVQELSTKKYQTWDWNFGFSPKYSYQHAIKIPAGYIEIHLDVEKGGTITKAKIFGDFFASNPIEELEEQFIGITHETEFIKAVLEKNDLTLFFGAVTISEILPLFS